METFGQYNPEEDEHLVYPSVLSEKAITSEVLWPPKEIPEPDKKLFYDTTTDFMHA